MTKPKDLADWAFELMEPTEPRRTVLFRGQPRKWPLQPTLLRTLPNLQAHDTLQKEQEALDHFRSQAHLHDPNFRVPPLQTARPKFAWWSVMQHYGAPTRLLDWTASPYVAAYFAAREKFDCEGEVFVIDAGRLEEKFKPPPPDDKWQSWHFNTTDHPALVYFTLAEKAARPLAQHGYFTVSTHVRMNHDKLLEQTGAMMQKWVVPSEQKSRLMHHLRTMNIAANTLFPGLDGLGRATGELIR